MQRRNSNKTGRGSCITRLVGLGWLLALLSLPALAGTNYILEVKGSSLQPVLDSHGLTLQRQLFSSPQLTVGVVSIPDGAQPAVAAGVAQDQSVLKFRLDRHLAAKAPKIAAANQTVANLQAWMLSMQNAQQKTNSYLSQPALGIVGSATGNKGAGVTVAVIDTAVDIGHPALAGKLVPGADCVGSVAVGAGQPNSCSGGGVTTIWNDPIALAQSTVIILDQSTVIILDQSKRFVS